MRAIRIIADLRVVDIGATKDFYTSNLGLSTEEFNLGWVARYTSPDTGAMVQLVTNDASAPEEPANGRRRPHVRSDPDCVAARSSRG